MLQQLWILFLLIVLPLPALAGEFMARDTRGHTTERIIPGDAPGQWVRRDPTGKRIGTIEDVAGTSGHTRVLRDSFGRRIGSMDQLPNGEWIVRDARGRRLETLRSDSPGSDYVRRDSSGNRIGTIESR